MIPEHVIEEIKARTDIVDLVASHLHLKRAGSSYRALCPFHNEKTPSFTVNPVRQIYHCFGCGKGGSVFRFVMDYEGVDFVTAAHMLAERANVTIEQDTAGAARQDIRQRLFQLNERALKFFHEMLLHDSAAEHARAYLRERQLDGDVIAQFQFGFAPDRWDAIESWARREGIDPDHLEQAGLLVKKEQTGGRSPHYYDRFRNRLMIPIRDEIGRVIGFTGRILGGDDTAAKYVNSPESPVFQKNRILFALHLARRALVDQRAAILCEGQIDAIRCHQAGFKNAVASQGTALTENHVRIIKRYCDEAILVMDPDTAGQNAALRAYELFLAAEVAVRVAVLPTGQDPDTLIRERGAEAFKNILASAPDGLTFMIDLLKTRERLDTDAGLTRALRSVLSTIRLCPGPVLRDKLLDEAAALLGVDRYALHAEFARLKSPKQAPNRTASEPQRPPSRPGAEAPANAGTPSAPPPPHEIALCEILLSGSPEACAVVHDYLPLDHVEHPACREIVRQCLEQARTPHPPEIHSREGTSEDLERISARILASPSRLHGEDFDPGQATRDILLTLYRKKYEARKRTVKKELARATGDLRAQLAEQHSQLTEDLLNIRKGWEYAQAALQC